MDSAVDGVREITHGMVEPDAYTVEAPAPAAAPAASPPAFPSSATGWRLTGGTQQRLSTRGGGGSAVGSGVSGGGRRVSGGGDGVGGDTDRDAINSATGANGDTEDVS